MEKKILRSSSPNPNACKQDDSEATTSPFFVKPNPEGKDPQQNNIIEDLKTLLSKEKLFEAVISLAMPYCLAQEIIKRYRHLSSLALVHNPNDMTRFNYLKVEEQLKAVFWIREHIKPHKTVDPVQSSYNYKHRLAHQFTDRPYYNNGEFKGAMYVAGYDKVKIDTPNWSYKTRGPKAGTEKPEGRYYE